MRRKRRRRRKRRNREWRWEDGEKWREEHSDEEKLIERDEGEWRGHGDE